VTPPYAARGRRPIRRPLVQRAALLLSDMMPARVARHLHSDSPLTKVVRPVANLILGGGRAWISVRSGHAQGLRLLIDPSSERFYWTGTYEPAVQDIIARRLGPGDTMWDVGAHIGFFAAIASQAVGRTGHVVAFEPLPANAARLREVIARNSLTNVSVREVAVSSSTGRQPFYVHKSTLMGSLAAQDDALEINVQTTTLDAELATSPPPALVKIDVEAFEDEVIAGARVLLVEFRPALIVELLSEQAVAHATQRLPGYSLRRIDQKNFLAEPTS
jgi:FkbM family methyltransferase